MSKENTKMTMPNKDKKARSITFGVLTLLTLGTAFSMGFLGLDKPVSFVNMLLLIGGIFGGFALAELLPKGFHIFRTRQKKVGD